jgi:hypothetical protein
MKERRAVAAAGTLAALVWLVSIAGAHPTAAPPPPGGPAPKALVGTYTTTLTRDEILSVPRPRFFPSNPRWKLIIINEGAGGIAPYALGLNPVGSGGPAIPFGVKKNRIFLQCINANGFPARGYSTYTWTLRGRTLTFKLVSHPCKSDDDRNQPIVLTSEPWKKRG